MREERNRLPWADPPGLAVPDALLDALAVRMADHLAQRIVPPPAAYLTVEEAAAYLHRPKSRVYELVAAKRLRHHRDGRTLLFRHADLDACLTTVEPESEAAWRCHPVAAPTESARRR